MRSEYQNQIQYKKQKTLLLNIPLNINTKILNKILASTHNDQVGFITWVKKASSMFKNQSM